MYTAVIDSTWNLITVLIMCSVWGDLQHSMLSCPGWMLSVILTNWTLTHSEETCKIIEKTKYQNISDEKQIHCWLVLKILSWLTHRTMRSWIMCVHSCEWMSSDTQMIFFQCVRGVWLEVQTTISICKLTHWTAVVFSTIKSSTITNYRSQIWR